jgi:pimeloyl-ACP methyl ester carboxylesterase
MRRTFSIGLTAVLVTVMLAACSSTQSPPAPSIVTTPVQTVLTSQGAVTYRSLGSGQPLLFIMGYASSQDLWPPALVDDLARHYRVITFNNAGIGGTAALPAPLTVTQMASQTAAFLAALHLSHVDVFGWSMGGMIAQALAATHPSDVNRLILASTNLGNGTAPATPALAAFVDATENHVTSVIYAGLFPANQIATQVPALHKAISSYPHFTEASTAVDQAQWSAIQSWDSGLEPAGHVGLANKALVADGANDILIPAVDVRQLAAAIPGSKLILYPDAGHAFIYQDEPAWASAMIKFLR